MWKSADLHHSAHVQGFIRDFALHIHFIVSDNSNCGQQRPILTAASEGPDQTAQVDLGLCSPHMPDGTFLHDAV